MQVCPASSGAGFSNYHGETGKTFVFSETSSQTIVYTHCARRMHFRGGIGDLLLRAQTTRKHLLNLCSRLLLLSLIVFSFAVLSFGQAPGAASAASAPIAGQLHDSLGAPIAGATLKLTPATGGAAVATTGGDGGFSLATPAAGVYRVSIVRNGQTYQCGQPLTLPAVSQTLALTLSSQGVLSYTVVTAASAGKASTSGGEQLSTDAVSSLPLNKRDFSQLLLLAAGTMTDSNGATNFTAQFAINGQRGVEATFAQDGADISDPEMGGATFSNFNVDAIEGIDSASGWMPAEVGRGSSGFTNIHTRSGSAGFHGSFFEFLRNSSLDARNYFDHSTKVYPGRIPPFRRNEFGFTNGGPIRIPGLYNGAGKSFYFVQYQGFRQVLGTTQVMPVPTEAERAGVETATFNSGGQTVTDTLTIPIPAKIAAILARYPLPNLPTGAFGVHTYATASKVDTTANQASLRIDHKFGAHDQFLARGNFNNLTGPITNPDQTALDPSFGVSYIDRQRNVAGVWTHTATPNLIFEMLIGITRSTPGFPTPNHTDPAVKFNDGLFEAFNGAGGSVMQAYGNLFQGREAVTWTHGKHSFGAGFEARINRDTTYFGMSPNGEYDFGGTPAYYANATTPITSASGLYDIGYGQQLPDTLSAFLSGSPAIYSAAIPSDLFSGGDHTGPAAINREDYAAWLQDTWKVTPTVTLDFGLRWDLYTPIKERAKRTASFQKIDGVERYVINPQPGYQTPKTGFEPRVQLSWAPRPNFTLHAGGAVMVIPPNIWQDNDLTGQAPTVFYPRLLPGQGAPIAYGYTINPSQLPVSYDLQGNNIYAHGGSKTVPANTIMDVDRFEKDLAKLSGSDIVSDLNLAGIEQSFTNGAFYTWTVGVERKIGAMTADAAYVGTEAAKLPRVYYPNAFPNPSPGFAPYTTFDNNGLVTGGLGTMTDIVATAHSTYHALQSSLSGQIPHGGPGIQASYTWSKSIDDTSQVQPLGQGSSGAVVLCFPQDPYNNHPERAPSSFDVTHGFSLSLAQNLDALHPRPARYLRPVVDGWELLSISSMSSGSPFSVYSGVQQTGYGSQGGDRPDQVGKPKLSTSRKDRQDYFGLGADNASYFSVPVNVTGGTGPNQGRFGTLGRDTFRGPAFYDFDFALIHDTSFGRRKSGAEKADLQFRGEFFNVFNIVNMGLPANTVVGTGFGEISKTAGTSRQIQFSLKLIY